MLPHIVLVSAVSTAGYSVILWSEVCVLRKLRMSSTFMNASTYRLQNDLHNALIALAICPVVSSLLPVSSFLVAIIFEINLSAVSPFLLIFVSFITVLNPITTCYFVKSFRNSLMRIVLCGKIPKHLGSSAVTYVNNYTTAG